MIAVSHQPNRPRFASNSTKSGLFLIRLAMSACMPFLPRLQLRVASARVAIKHSIPALARNGNMPFAVAKNLPEGTTQNANFARTVRLFGRIRALAGRSARLVGCGGGGAGLGFAVPSRVRSGARRLRPMVSRRPAQHLFQ